MRSMTAAALIVPLAIALGCGSDDASPSAAQPMAKADFIAEADRLCTKTGTKYDAWSRPCHHRTSSRRRTHP